MNIFRFNKKKYFTKKINIFCPYRQIVTILKIEQIEIIYICYNFDSYLKLKARFYNKQIYYMLLTHCLDKYYGRKIDVLFCCVIVDFNITVG